MNAVFTYSLLALFVTGLLFALAPVTWPLLALTIPFVVLGYLVDRSDRATGGG